MSTVGCIEAFAFLPCSDNAAGSAFLAIVYSLIIRQGLLSICKGMSVGGKRMRSDNTHFRVQAASVSWTQTGCRSTSLEVRSRHFPPRPDSRACMHDFTRIDFTWVLPGTTPPGFHAGLVLPLINTMPLLLIVAGAVGTDGLIDRVQVAAAAVAGTSSALFSVWGLALFLGRCELMEVRARL